MPLNEMYQKLLSIGQVTPVPLTPLQPPFPQWYRPDQKYEYHTGISGHNIDNCVSFKRRILQLIKAGWISFDDFPNVKSNPLPHHASGSGVNALEEERGTNILRLTMERLYKMLKRAGYLKAPIKKQAIEHEGELNFFLVS